MARRPLLLTETPPPAAVWTVLPNSHMRLPVKSMPPTAFVSTVPAKIVAPWPADLTVMAAAVNVGIGRHVVGVGNGHRAQAGSPHNSSSKSILPALPALRLRFWPAVQGAAEGNRCTSLPLRWSYPNSPRMLVRVTAWPKVIVSPLVVISPAAQNRTGPVLNKLASPEVMSAASARWSTRPRW